MLLLNSDHLAGNTIKTTLEYRAKGNLMRLDKL